MAIKNILIEGVSGSGKTTVAEELERRGHHVIHGDRVLAYIGDPETGEALDRPDFDTEVEAVAWSHAHWVWPVEKVKTEIADKSREVTFFCGGSRNHHQFIHLFDKVFVLEVDHDTLMQCLSRRGDDEFGGRVMEKELIVRLHATGEGVPKGGVRVDARAEVEATVNAILAEVYLQAFNRAI